MQLPAYTYQLGAKSQSIFHAVQQLHGTESRGLHLAMLAARHENGQIHKQFEQQQIGYKQADGQASCQDCFFFKSASCSVVKDAKADGTCGLHLDNKSLQQQASLYSDVDTLVKELASFVKANAGVKGIKTLEDFGYPDLWLTSYTNPYQDKEGEFFAEKAIAADLEFINASGNYPELWWGHVKGTRHGKAFWVGMLGRFAVALGTFDDTLLGHAFKKYYKECPDPLKVSHQYVYAKEMLDQGVHNLFHTFEISTMKAGKESNPYTGFVALSTKDNSMQATTDQVAGLVEALQGYGMDATQAKMMGNVVAGDFNSLADQLETMGIARKMAGPEEDKVDDAPSKSKEEDGEEKEEEKTLTMEDVKVAVKSEVTAAMDNALAPVLKALGLSADSGQKDDTPPPPPPDQPTPNAAQWVEQWASQVAQGQKAEELSGADFIASMLLGSSQ